jgi:uncharacterized cupredoxin-like copper-binding protein
MMATQLQRWTAVVLVGAAGVVIGACGGGSNRPQSTVTSAAPPTTSSSATTGAPSTTSSSAGGTEKPAAEAPSGTKINVVGKEFSYDPAKLTLKAGQGSTIVLKNTGSIEHDLTVDTAGFKLTVPGNNTGEKVLKVDTPGTYEFYCSVEGHKDGGMKGELTVT